MVRTQIQLPDELYAEIKELAQKREVSFAELARRGLEYMASIYSSKAPALEEWSPPKPGKCARKDLTLEDIVAATSETDDSFYNA